MNTETKELKKPLKDNLITIHNELKQLSTDIKYIRKDIHYINLYLKYHPKCMMI